MYLFYKSPASDCDNFSSGLYSFHFRYNVDCKLEPVELVEDELDYSYPMLIKEADSGYNYPVPEVQLELPESGRLQERLFRLYATSDNNNMRHYH